MNIQKKISIKACLMAIFLLILIPVICIQAYEYYQSYQRRYNSEK